MANYSINIGGGMRFYPTDQELILMYLLRKHSGERLPHENMVLERDLYAKEPWEVFNEGAAAAAGGGGNSDDRIRYYFTTLRKKGKKSIHGTRYERTVAGKNGGGGTWYGNGKPKAILHDKKVIGHVTTFTYQKKKKKNELGEGEDNNEGGSWLMKEYTLDKHLLRALTTTNKRDKTVSDDCVLCRVKRKKDKEEDHNTAVESNLWTDDQEIDNLVMKLMKDGTSTPSSLPPQIDHHHHVGTQLHELLVDDHGANSPSFLPITTDIMMTVANIFQDNETDRDHHQIAEFTMNEYGPLLPEISSGYDHEGNQIGDHHQDDYGLQHIIDPFLPTTSQQETTRTGTFWDMMPNIIQVDGTEDYNPPPQKMVSACFGHTINKTISDDGDHSFLNNNNNNGAPNKYLYSAFYR